MIHERAFTIGQVSFHSANANYTANVRVFGARMRVREGGGGFSCGS